MTRTEAKAEAMNELTAAMKILHMCVSFGSLAYLQAMG